MSVSNGQDANEVTFNTAFVSRNSATTDTAAQFDLVNISTTDLIDLQRVVNEALASLGISNQAATDATANTYSSNSVVTDGDDRKVAVGKLDEKFNGASGHSHDGTAGNGPLISATSLTDFNNLSSDFGEFTFDAASGTSIDVSTLFTSKTSGGDAVTEGVVTSNPNNYVPILEKDTGGEIEDNVGDRIFARLTEAAGVWTLSFFANKAGVETSHSLSSQDIRFLYREVFTAANRPTIGANVAVYDTQSAVGDIPDASNSQRGVVSTSAQDFAGVKNFTSRPTVSSVDVLDISAAQVVTNKDIDGGTASNTSRLTVPKNTTVNIAGLTRKEATIFYDTDQSGFFGDDGTSVISLGGGGGTLVSDTARLYGANGSGSTATRIRRYINYAFDNSGYSFAALSASQTATNGLFRIDDSASQGTEIVILKAGVFTISASDQKTAAGDLEIGISLNSTQRTTGISGINAADRVSYSSIRDVTGIFETIAVSLNLQVGDIIRMHHNGNATGVGDTITMVISGQVFE